MINRREFLGIIGGVTVVSLSACSSSLRSSAPGSTAAGSTGPGTTGADSTASTVAGTAGATSPTATVPGGTVAAGAHRRVLVIVQLNGGNDGLNTLIPAAGQYHDARPTLAIAEADRIVLSGRTDYALHPSLAPLAPLWTANQLAFLDGVGFPDQNHSHFVAMDQWWRADRLSSAEGWLGTYLKSLATTDPLYATALNSGAPLLNNATNPAAVVFRPASFKFNKLLSDDLLKTMSAPLSSDPLQAAAQTALSRSVAAVNSFADVLSNANDTAQPAAQTREGGASLSDGLATAAKLITENPNTRIVVVSAAGFDTHANQLATQADLLKDLANGLTAFMASIAKAGMADDVLVVTTSEFGRRVAENGSGGTDHGTGNVSFVLGTKIKPGIQGDADLANQINGDVKAGIDPRTIYTGCLDWIGGDAATVLGKRYDDIKILV